MITLRQPRIERGWSQSRAIAELQRHDRSLGLQLPSAASLKTELSRWENGHRTPDAFYRRLFELAYGCSASDLGLGQVEHSAALQAAAGWEEAVNRSTGLWRGDMQRRDFLTAAGYVAGAFAAPTLHALVTGSQEPPARQHGNGPNVAAADVAFVQEMTGSLGLLDNRHGGGQVRRSAVAFLHDEVAPLLTGAASQKPPGKSSCGLRQS